MRRRSLFRRAISFVLLSLLCFLPHVEGQAETPLGATASGGEDYRAPNIPLQFSKLQHHGDPLGANLGVGDDPNSSSWFGIGPDCKHYQSIARATNAAGVPYFILTRSGNKTDGCPNGEYDPGELLIIRLGSRNRDGERLRSNRLEEGVSIASTIPSQRDIGVKSMHFDGVTPDSAGQVWPFYWHPGGTQLVDGVLAVALECPWLNSVYEPIEWCPSWTGMALIDMHNPDDPRLLLHQSLVPELGQYGEKGVTHWISLTKDPATGKYLFILGTGFATQIRLVKHNGLTHNDTD